MTKTIGVIEIVAQIRRMYCGNSRREAESGISLMVDVWKIEKDTFPMQRVTLEMSRLNAAISKCWISVAAVSLSTIFRLYYARARLLCRRAIGTGDASATRSLPFAMTMAQPNATDGNFKPIPMAHREAEPFLDMMRYRPIVELVEEFVGGRASGVGSEYFYMRPGTAKASPLIKTIFISRRRRRICFRSGCRCVMLMLGLRTVERPTFYPGSHRFGALPVRDGEMLADPGQNPGARAVETMVILPGEFPPFDVRI